MIRLSTSSLPYVKANAEFFDSVGTQVVMGRGIREQDTSTASPVAVVNESFVKKLLGKRNPLGRRIGPAGPESSGDFEIVGVVKDTAYESARLKDHPMFFTPLMQRDVSDKEPIENDMSLYAGAIVIQTDRPVDNMEALARKTLASINPNLTVVKFQTFEEQIAERFSQERMISRLTMLFGATGAAAGDHRLVWSHRVYGSAADSGDWHPHGARGGARRSDCDGVAGGHAGRRRLGS